MTASPGEASLLCRTLSSYFTPDEGSISWKTREVFSEPGWYRSQLLSFNSEQDLFARLTVGDNLRLYADFFSVESTVDKKILGPVDQEEYVCYLDSYQITRLKLSIFNFISRPLFFYSNPFARLNPEQRSSAVEIFEKIPLSETLMITTGTVPVEKAHVMETVSGAGK